MFGDLDLDSEKQQSHTWRRSALTSPKPVQISDAWASPASKSPSRIGSITVGDLVEPHPNAGIACRHSPQGYDSAQPRQDEELMPEDRTAVKDLLLTTVAAALIGAATWFIKRILKA